MSTVERYRRGARWLHAGIYLTVLVLLGTGWWFLLVGYGRSDYAIHRYAGYAMAGVLLGWLARGARGLRMFVRETLRWRRGDGRWLAGLPRAAFTGRFRSHDGHFDPGQRLANVAMVLTLGALVVTGLAMLLVPRNPFSGLLADVHHWAALLTTPVLVGHMVIAAGVLPGYRGVWRSMHLGGRLPVDVARRIWPGPLPVPAHRREDQPAADR
jgi:formate dehydrogenase subunit gamma